MGVIAGILTRLGIRSNDGGTDGLEALQNYLRAQEATLQLTAVYEQPTFSSKGEPTAVFPYRLYNDGTPYGAGVKEFTIPDDGLSEQGAPLTEFLRAHEISVVEDIGEIEGQSDDARVNAGGDVEVAY